MGSLQIDCEQYIGEGIKKPSIIVVSGDLIEGTQIASQEEALKEIKRQYDEVSIFLQQLVDYFLDGDKSRIIIVPGNHDVNFTISKLAMMKESIPLNDNALHLLKRKVANKEIRWNWKDLSIYKIQDTQLYKSRFDSFVEFYNSFFKGLSPKREWANPCEENAQLIDLPEYNICFLELNSCYKLDHLNDAGEICPAAFTKFHNRIRQIFNRGSLIVGVWHHHTVGLPYESNYLDHRILQSMISSGLRIGLHGHQHLPSVINTFHDLNQKEKMLLISSGSLYGGQNELVTGCPRQYCLISLAFTECDVNVQLHVRKDSLNYDIPNWVKGQIGMYSATEFSQSIKLPPLSVGQLISEIDEYSNTTNDYENAYLKLDKIKDLAPDICSTYMDKYLSKIHNSDFIIEHIHNPSTDHEYTYLLKAAIDKQNLEIISELRSDDRFNNIKGALNNYLREEALKLFGK
jgi:hypothetical protein